VSDERTALSEREMEILRLVATGATNLQIAHELIISVNTVKVHLRNIYAKLGVASRTEATMVAVSEGWVGVPRLVSNGELEETPDSRPTPPTPPALPQLERWPRVSIFKRVSLVVAVLLALPIWILPLIPQGNANGRSADPIGGVFPTAPAPSSDTRWFTRAQMPTPRTDLALAVHDGLIYAIGGVSNEGVTGKVEVYDPRTDAWSVRRAKPTPVGFAGAAAVGTKIYLPGGIAADRQPQKTLEIYDPGLDAWESGAALPEPLSAYGLAALDGHLYLFGGWNGRQYTAAVYRYDPATDRWESLQPLGEARGFLAAAALGDRIFLVGGYDDTAELDNCDIYTPATGLWSSCAPMGLRRGGLALVPVRDSLYALGGGMRSYVSFNERYDSRVDVWSRIETPVLGQWQGLGAAFVSPTIYAIGGWNGANLSVNEAYQALYQVILR